MPVARGLSTQEAILIPTKIENPEVLLQRKPVEIISNEIENSETQCIFNEDI